MARKRKNKLIKTLMAFAIFILIAGIYLMLVKTIDNFDKSDSSSEISLSSKPDTDIYSETSRETATSSSATITENTTNTTTVPPEQTMPADIPEQTMPVEIVEPVLPVGIDNEWAFILINADNPIPDNYTFTTKPVYNNGERDFYIDERCYEYAAKMLADARLAGYELNVISAYRSVEQQQYNIEASINNLIAQGYSYEDAEMYTMKEIQYPGCSEHNAGLAMDILTADWWGKHTTINAEFENTPEFDWLYANSWKYGFVLRYPKDKEDITKISYEPWHYRFVGLYHAQKMVETGFCLEEYFATQ